MHWLALTATLPTRPSALRVRVWRALKATGAGTLREGVYLLPDSAATAPALWELERLIREAGADAHLLVISARDAAQERAFMALFDRGDAYADLLLRLKAERSNLKTAGDAALRRALRRFDQEFQAIAAVDFFAGPAQARAAAALAAWRREVERRLSPGEPTAQPRGAVPPEPVAAYQGRRWATRKRPWVDRLASAWLIQRFVDRQPRFVWIDTPAACPKHAIGYDFDGARFTHVGELVTFEVLAATFSLDSDPGLRALGSLVHSIDVGGALVEEAAGVELLVRGLQRQHRQDDALLAAALPLFDTLYAALQEDA